jgi:hypothetical protein
VVFEISLSEKLSPPPTTLTTTTRSYPQLYDVSALALLSPKTSRFIGLTTYRSDFEDLDIIFNCLIYRQYKLSN